MQTYPCQSVHIRGISCARILGGSRTPKSDSCGRIPREQGQKRHTYHHQEDSRVTGTVGEVASAVPTRFLEEIKVRPSERRSEHRHKRIAEGPEGITKRKIFITFGGALQVVGRAARVKHRVEGQSKAQHDHRNERAESQRVRHHSPDHLPGTARRRGAEPCIGRGSHGKSTRYAVLHIHPIANEIVATKLLRLACPVPSSRFPCQNLRSIRGNNLQTKSRNLKLKLTV